LSDELRTDIRRLLTAFAAGFVVLGSMTIGAYAWLSADIVRATTRLETRLDRLETRLDKQADQLLLITSTMARIEQKLDDLTNPPAPLPHRP
jgi:hypothetical protein